MAVGNLSPSVTKSKIIDSVWAVSCREVILMSRVPRVSLGGDLTDLEWSGRMWEPATVLHPFLTATLSSSLPSSLPPSLSHAPPCVMLAEWCLSAISPTPLFLGVCGDECENGGIS
ncbi:hypothetical protein E2C01_005562 [Portunus trituberculatus]|uniref:Uncharacterized protein n=1 Tax=Portunus trituberculatus TaxID=210409 RepID=A0A5B7CUN0_PORTR|nr:hypothetical protein [Portunus trituberculatus]